MGAEGCEEKYEWQQPKDSEEDDVMDQYSSSLKGLNLANDPGNPVARVFLKQLVEAAKIFIRPVGAGGPLALQGSSNQGKNGTCEEGNAHENRDPAVMPIHADRDAGEELQIAESVGKTFKISPAR